MKKQAAILLAVVFFHGIALSQFHLEGSFNFSSQQQIEDFGLRYPCCTEIEGDVSIQGHLVDSLGGLKGLTHVGGDLRIGTFSSAITFYTSLKGLQNLASVGGNLEIINNGSLRSLAGLENLAFVGGDLKIINNIPLADLSALSNLKQVGGMVKVSGNQFLKNFFGLQNLQRIDGDLLVSDNPELETFFGLQELTTVTGNFRIIANGKLSSLSGLGNLVHVKDTFQLSKNPMLANLDGLSRLAIIGGGMMIGGDDGGNASLSSLQGLKNLSTIKGFVQIIENGALASLDGLENIGPQSIWDLQISNNRSLSDCSTTGIAQYLSHPSGKVVIKDNADGCNSPAQAAAGSGMQMSCLPYGNYYFENQQDIDRFATDFPGCTLLSGDVIISGTNINSLKGLDPLQGISGNLIIYDNDKLESLAGLENIEFISQSLIIMENDGIRDLAGLNGLHEIGDLLDINFNKGLKGLSGLENLFIIRNRVHIEGNNALVDITGLQNVDASYLNSFAILNNFNLSVCNIHNLCDYLNSKDLTISAFNNASGCKNLYEVESSCYLSNYEMVSITEHCSYYANPATGEITFSFDLSGPSLVKLVIYDSKGLTTETVVEELMESGKHHFNWTPNTSKDGVYFYNLSTGPIHTAGQLFVSR